MSQPEPTTSDVLHAIKQLDVRLTELQGSVGVRLVEVQAALAEFRLSTAQRFEDVQRRLETLFDEVAAFRASHTHD
jgi:hypothetical protein